MPTLRSLLESPDQSVRLKAALAAGTYPEDGFIEVLISQCAVETDFFVRDTLSWALMRNDVVQVVKRLETEELREKAAKAKIALSDETRICRFDPPFKPGFLQYNEIVIPASSPRADL